MSLHRLGSAVLLLAASLFVPQASQAQFGVNQFNNPCCNVCGQRVCTCSTTRPVVETHMRPQNCLTYQDRKRIVCKTEPVCVTVPVTKVDCVTVDEGCYQMVWVPRPVTKAIPRTELHQRMSCRTVPVEVCEKVPVMTTRMVPQQTIRYVTEHRTVTTTPPVPLCPPPPCPAPCPAPCAPGFAPGAYGGGGYGTFGGAFGIPSVVPGLGGPGFGPPAGFGGGSPVAVPYSAMREGAGVGTNVAAAVPPALLPVTAGIAPVAQYADAAPPAVRQVSGTMARPANTNASWQTPRR